MFNQSLIKKGVLVTLAVSLLVTLILLLSTADGRTWAGLLQFNPWSMVVALLMLLGSWVIEGLRLQLLTRMMDGRIGLWDSILIYLATLFGGNVTPFTTGGPPTQVYLLHRKGLSVGKATAVMSIRMALSSLTTSIFAPLLFVLFRNHFPNFWASDAILFVGAVVSGLSALPMLLPRQTKQLFQWIVSRPLFRMVLGNRFDATFARLVSEAEEFHTNLVAIRKWKKGELALVCLYTVLYWPLYLAIAPVILLFGLGLQVVMTTLMVMQFVWMFLISCVPVPGGSGVTEVGFAALFKLFGVPGPLLGVFVLLWRMFSFYISTFLGGAVFMRFVAKSPTEEGVPG